MILDNIVIINNEDFHESRDLNFEFGKGQYINFTQVSTASRASIRRQTRETTPPRAADEPLSSFLEDLPPFLLQCISQLDDGLWLVRPSPDTSSPGCFTNCSIVGHPLDVFSIIKKYIWFEIDFDISSL